MAVDRTMTVLIVDDYKTMLRIIHNLLKQIGFDNVDEATDGASALAMARQNSYGMITAESKTENVVAAKEAGVNDYIVKPFNAETLRTKVSAVLGAF